MSNVVGTEIALIHKVAKVRKIELWDYKRIHDECVTYANSLKNSYADCNAKIYPEYKQFIDKWNGGLLISKDNLANTERFMEESIDKLESVLKIDSTILKMDMASLDKHQIRQENNEVDILFRDYWNSYYKYIEISVTLKDWTEKTINAYKEELKDCQELLKLSEQEIVDQFTYDKADLEKAFELFKQQEKKESLEEVLKTVVKEIKTEKLERAYVGFLLSIIEVYRSSEVDLNKYWFKIVKRAYDFRKEE